jgi:hypothetical protein
LERELGRGFTCADIGGWDGYFAVRLAEDLGAKTLNVDQRESDLPNHRQMTVDAGNVGNLGRFDVILALSVLHHMEDWREVYGALRRQCLLLVVEVCHPQEAASQSPVLMRTGHRVAPIHEQVSADASELVTETPCLDDERLRRPMYLVRQGAWGVVETGSGQAAGLMTKTKPTAWKALGYDPHPGTLNLSVTSEAREWLEGLSGVKAPGLGRSTNYVPVSVGSIPAHVHFARSKTGPRRTVELVAPVNLRETLELADGDMLEVRCV